MGSTTRIDKALRLAQKQMFIKANGGRADAKKILFLLTDGKQSIPRGLNRNQNPDDPSIVANELRASGVVVIVVGIGPGTDADELIRLAGGEENAFRAASFDELNSRKFLKKVADKACKAGE